MESSSKRWPRSSTVTRWPFSLRRSALTEPPKPEPMTTQSVSKEPSSPVLRATPEMGPVSVDRSPAVVAMPLSLFAAPVRP
ncbi:unannotated protein [freshwater metagenome]|uniref:Unannotated protein n=1 Tax=freshwater metagenome TaxID=449393 RepID=A0A6J7L0L7_9ZZZZ